MLQYADDSVVLSTGSDVVETVNRLNRQLVKIQDWLNIHDLNLSIEKSRAVLFQETRKLIRQPVHIMIEGNMIPWVESTEYLGITFNNKLSWKAQIEKNINKALKGINIMRVVAGVW